MLSRRMLRLSPLPSLGCPTVTSQRFSPASRSLCIWRSSSVSQPQRPFKLCQRIYDDLMAPVQFRQKLLLCIAGGVVLVTVTYVAYSTWERGWLLGTSRGGVLDTFVAGGIFAGSEPDPFVEKDSAADVLREELNKQLERLLRPAATDTYAVIVGEHGTGKSTAVRKAARASSKDGANGVMYFLIGEALTISTDLAKSLRVGREYDAFQILFRRQFAESASQKYFEWQDYSATVKVAASAFRRKYKRPMTLVIDGVHKLETDNPKFLDKLQDFAKDAADTGSLNVVFVSSDNTALVHMKSRSSWSRASKPLEIGDIPDAAAVAFLEHRHGLGHKRATELVRDVTGGRFSLLLDPSVAIDDGASARRDEKYNETSTRLKSLGFSPKHAFFLALVDSKAILSGAALDLLTKDQIDALLAANIIAVHVDGTYTGHSRFVETFLKKAALPATVPNPGPGLPPLI